MKIDAHQHFWKFNTTEYAWISDKMKVLKRDFLPDEMLQELHGIGFDGSIAVQARQKPEETRWLLDIAAGNEFVKGVVGWIDLCSDECGNQLNEFVTHSKFVGVRHVLQDESDERFMLRESFIRGLSILGKYDIVYELLILPDHLRIAEELVMKFPEQKFVLDHIAKPMIKSGVISQWKEDICRLARHPNVNCKLSGMVTEASWGRWKKEDFLPYLNVVMDAFGTSRLMIGSDWPVCTVSSSYNKAMNLVIDYLASLNQAERDLVLGLNAVRTYKLQNQ